MRLPNVERAIVEGRKLDGYLLDDGHPDNGGKAAFFIGWGFDAATLRDALLAMVAVADVVETIASPWGVKHVVDGPLDAPRGRTPSVRCVWIVDAGDAAPRLVTAYPA